MLRFYTAQDGRLVASGAENGGVFVSAAAPTEEELRRLSQTWGLSAGLLHAAASQEMLPRVEQVGGAVLIACALPVSCRQDGSMRFRILPFSLLCTAQTVVAVSPQGTPAAEELLQTPFLPARRGAKLVYFFLQLLVQRFRLHLRQIEKFATYQQAGAAHARRLKELLELEKALVSYSEALEANGAALEKLARLQPFSEEDRLLVEHVRMELHREGETAAACSRLVDGTIGTFASLASSRLNRTLRAFTAATLLFAFLLFGFSAYGLGTHGVPAASAWIVLALAVLCMSSAALMMYKRRV